MSAMSITFGMNGELCETLRFSSSRLPFSLSSRGSAIVRRVERPLTADHYEIEGVVAKEEGVVVFVISWAFVCFVQSQKPLFYSCGTHAVTLFSRYSCHTILILNQKGTDTIEAQEK